MRPEAIAGVIAAVTTPFAENGNVNPAEMVRIVRWLEHHNLAGVMLMGTTGEGPWLTIEEQELILDAFGREAWQIKLIPHVGHPTVRHTTQLAVRAKQLGAHGVSAVTPYYYPITDENLVSYYRALAQAVTPLPVYLYSIPVRTGRTIAPKVFERLLELEENIAGIKDSSGSPELLAHYTKVARAHDAAVLCGSDRLLLYAMMEGAHGMVCSGAACFPEVYARFWEASSEGLWQEAHDLQGRIQTICDLLGDGTVLSNYKSVLSLRGFHAGQARAPLIQLSEEEVSALRQAILAEGLPL